MLWYFRRYAVWQKDLGDQADQGSQYRRHQDHEALGADCGKLFAWDQWLESFGYAAGAN